MVARSLQVFVFLQLIYLVQAVLFINTWPFKGAAESGWAAMMKTGSAMDAVVEGCSRCERDQCDFTVGYGGSPDEDGESRLDAMLMDGNTMDVGAVASMPDIKDAVKVARSVLEHTKHTMLVGTSARDFAISMGFERSNLTTPHSTNSWKNWLSHNCQPNFRKNVSPDPRTHCGPYEPLTMSNNNNHNDNNNNNNNKEKSIFSANNHDTIGAVAIGPQGQIVAGTSTNGASFKIPGRVGDSAITGSGAYADSEVGGASATGNGDVMMRFLPSFLAVELMRISLTPERACQLAVERIKRYYPSFMGAVIAVNKNQEFGAACSGMARFEFMVMKDDFDEIRKYHVDCLR